MNIRHLVGKQVTVVHVTKYGVKAVIHGKLETVDSGSFRVYTTPVWFAYIKRLLGNASDSGVSFPWDAVSDVYENIISIIELSEEEILEELRKFGV